MSIILAYGAGQSLSKICLSSQHRYQKEELVQIMQKKTRVDHWFIVDNIRIRIQTPDQLEFACDIVSAYHNSICFNESDYDSVYSESILDNDQDLDEIVCEEDPTNVPI